MTLSLSSDTYAQIKDHLHAAYPDEAAGLLLGSVDSGGDGLSKTAKTMLPLPNRFEAGEQFHRYLITAQDMLAAESEAERLALEVIGVFHSHPDHPAQASEYDREFALPWYSYLIVSVQNGAAAEARAWLLAEDRSHFVEEELVIQSN